MKTAEVTLAFSDASGALYGLRLLEQLVLAEVQVHVVISTAGQRVMAAETEFQLPAHPSAMAEYLSEHFSAKQGQIKVYDQEQWSSPLASGTAAPNTMIVCPCSAGSLAAIASGVNHNLLERAAEVVIKEQGKLILVVREMPLSTIHLKHMLSLSQLGVCIMPASPGFYFKPQRVGELVDFVVSRILDHIHVPHQLSKRWGSAV